MKIKNGEYHEEDGVDEKPVRIESVSVCSQVKCLSDAGSLTSSRAQAV